MQLRHAAAFLLLLPALGAAPSPANTDATRFNSDWVYFPAAKPLTEIPVYQIEPTANTADLATKALAAEIERLYTHAKTLASGHERRAFETRIYLLEKRIRPLAQSFSLSGWETLRADVRAEWIAVQATLAPSAKSSAS